MLRGRAKARSRYEPTVIVPSLKHNANATSPPSSFSGAGSVGAPTEVLKWQVEMYDLARQLKAELDCKIIAVRKLTLDYNQAAERLNAAIAEARTIGHTQTSVFELVQRLAAEGLSLPQISKALSLPVDQLQSSSKADDGLQGSSPLQCQKSGADSRVVIESAGEHHRSVPN